MRPRTSSQIYAWCFAKYGRPIPQRHRHSVWRILVKIADQVERRPPYGAWLWRLRHDSNLKTFEQE
jgi:hypothetical protein